MIGKVIGGQSFAGTVGYVMKQDAGVLDSEGITPPNVRDMVQDFHDQTLLNPRVKNIVGHISLSFSEQDKAKLTDKVMTETAREYMQKMGIDNTQYLIVRHHDAPHPHLHIVYNRVKNDSTTVPDSNIRYRNVAVCKELTEKYGLYYAPGKDHVREHRLREPDRTKYEIYNSIKAVLPNCKSWNDLGRELAKREIGLEFKYKGGTGIKEGVRFSKGQYTFSGSKIDQKFSYSKLDNYFKTVQKVEQKPEMKYSTQSKSNLKTAIGNYISIFGKCFPSSGKADNGNINLSAFGGDNLPAPPMDLGIGISSAQLQRRPDETPEQHIARITVLINSITAAMTAYMEEQKRHRQQQIKKPKMRLQ